jgi:hypothetical protein
MTTRFNLFRSLLCLLGHHKRSRGQAHDGPSHLVSVCRYCGTAMKRVDGRWVVGDDEAVAKPPAT